MNTVGADALFHQLQVSLQYIHSTMSDILGSLRCCLEVIVGYVYIELSATLEACRASR